MLYSSQAYIFATCSIIYYYSINYTRIPPSLVCDAIVRVSQSAFCSLLFYRRLTGAIMRKVIKIVATPLQYTGNTRCAVLYNNLCWTSKLSRNKCLLYIYKQKLLPTNCKCLCTLIVDSFPIHAYRLDTGSFLLWVHPDPDSWRLVGREGRGEVGVWCGYPHDLRLHPSHSSGCLL